MTNRQNAIAEAIRRAYIDVQEIINDDDFDIAETKTLLNQAKNLYLKGIYQVAFTTLLELVIAELETEQPP